MTGSGDRLIWLDLARGFAVVSMIIAHTWPWGGLWSVVEYLTAPWFALLIGLSLSLAWQKGRERPARFVLDNVVRGGLLIALGISLQTVYAQIVVVLQTLGALTVVAALLMVASGTSAEVLGATLLSLSATVLCMWLVHVLGAAGTRRWLGAVVDTGRMALSAYCLQILALAAIVGLWLPGRRDDHWWVTASVTAICLGTSWLWLRFFRQGPVEAVLRLPSRLWRPRTAPAEATRR